MENTTLNFYIFQSGLETSLTLSKKMLAEVKRLINIETDEKLFVSMAILIYLQWCSVQHELERWPVRIK